MLDGNAGTGRAQFSFVDTGQRAARQRGGRGPAAVVILGSRIRGDFNFLPYNFLNFPNFLSSACINLKIRAG